jgi:hypothetical protein
MLRRCYKCTRISKVESLIGTEFETYDYDPWPTYHFSIGFTVRGCRLRCGHCVVPKKEGGPRANATIRSIWRGPGYPKNIVLLDNDFFGQPQADWEARCAEILDDGYKVSFNQGINIRIIDDSAARAIAALPYYDDDFKVRRIYTAFDNANDERVFRVGVERLLNAGVRGDHILAYALIGYDGRETDASIFNRIAIMRSYGIRPYPMVFQPFDDNAINVPLGFDFGASTPDLSDAGITTLELSRPRTIGAIRKIVDLSTDGAEIAAETVKCAWSARYRFLKDIQRQMHRFTVGTGC